jgi:hypothetical protein
LDSEAHLDFPIRGEFNEENSPSVGKVIGLTHFASRLRRKNKAFSL